ncbi:MAG: hypothetical protein HWN79_12450 [Candidatus Lokiarchaeota archaeon]|nr:hypothetical protein [Candidatus Lokiarchaeota archaeon]
MKSKIRTFISIFLLILSVLIASNNHFELSYAQSNGDSLTIPTNFVIHEFSKATGTIESNNSINVEIKSPTWNITTIELNFTDVKLGREVKVIEDEYGEYDLKYVDKKVKAFGVQVNITEPTIVYGVKIFGSILVNSSESIYFQVNGYDNLKNCPNSTIYGAPVLLNMTNYLLWHTQTFLSPIPLSAGQYFFVLNGTKIITSEPAKYNWAFNGVDPNYPNLYASEYTLGAWLNGVQGKPFLYQIIQQVNRYYNPESINMTAEIDGVSYNITNGIDSGTGNLILSNLNFSPNNENLQIPISNGISVGLFFNLSYSLQLKGLFYSESSVVIQEGIDNSWVINPEITRYSENYSVEFSFPKSWYNLTFERNGANVTSDVFIDYINNYVTIPNDTITEGASWLITASSTEISFGLTVDRTEFLAGQELKFFIADPVLEGNYTFILNDPFHDKIYTNNKTIPSISNSFTYIIPSTALDGSYEAFVYWYNGTDAGVTTQVFSITLPFTVDWALIISIVVIAGLGSAVTLSSVVLTKKNKRKKLAAKEKIINKFMDILNLNYIIVIEKKSSLNVYDKAFTEKRFDSTLISGFLEAIRTFGLDISGSEERSQTVKLEYKNSKILMSDFKHFRLIFILKDLPSPQFYEVINDLSLKIEEKYGNYLKEFKGNLQPFEGIENLLKSHLGTSFLYPLKLVGPGRMKISPTEKSLINNAIAVMKKNQLDYFYITHLMAGKVFNSKEVEALYSLIIKRIFNPFV